MQTHDDLFVVKIEINRKKNEEDRINVLSCSELEVRLLFCILETSA